MKICWMPAKNRQPYPLRADFWVGLKPRPDVAATDDKQGHTANSGCATGAVSERDGDGNGDGWQLAGRRYHHPPASPRLCSLRKSK
jgi:hypothetical protein